MKKVPSGKGFLIRRSAGEEHTQLYLTDAEGKVLKQAVVQNTELPEVVVVDGFLEKNPNFIATHGDLVTAFIKKGNPFVNIIKKNVDTKSIDEKGQPIYIIDDDKVRNAFHRLYSQDTKFPIAINASIGYFGQYESKASYKDLLEFLGRHFKVKEQELRLREKIINERKIPIYQSAGHKGHKNPENGKINCNLESTVPNTCVVGGVEANSNELHLVNSSVEYITHTAPFEYKVSYNEKGINITGGDPSVAGVNFTYAQMGLKTPEEIRAYQSGLPSIIKGNSFATPYELARKTLGEIPKFISEHANKVPPLPKALLEQAKRLGILEQSGDCSLATKFKPRKHGESLSVNPVKHYYDWFLNENGGG